MLEFIYEVQLDVLDEYEKLIFLKKEVKRLNKENERLSFERQMAYSCGYEDRDTGRSYDDNFKIDDLRD